ncbi:MAG: AraC family transcriptional regulator [Candidatus Borkfalkiaceae bacterium]|nr:AraC family transcriptional regulator [Clostridia bacterium]MDY6223951.1 AraC family transcriptional regulator [Christensenellaceae bacterium]
MNYVSAIQRAINYVEDHLTERLTFDEIAKQAYFSSFSFQRAFSLLCGISLGDYIRFRRLSVAGEEIARKKTKVIDAALRYGYESPESFTRAFTAFHGVTPREAGKSGKIRSFSPLTVKLIVSGGNLMEYSIKKLDDFQIVCKRKNFKKQQEITTREISSFWQECGKNGVTQRLINRIPANPRLQGLLGVSFSAEGDGAEFPYGLAAEYNGEPVPEGFELITLPAATYAVFPVRGKMPDAFVETYTKICKEFFPQSGYEYANGAEIEVYPSNDTQNPDYYCEIWVAVK